MNWIPFYIIIGLISYYMIYLGLVGLHIINYGVIYGFYPEYNLSFLFIIFGGVGVYGLYYHYKMMRGGYRK